MSDNLEYSPVFIYLERILSKYIKPLHIYLERKVKNEEF